MIMVTTIELMVPNGIERRGSFKSPDKLAPAIIPVTAGKNTANTLQKPASSKFTIQSELSYRLSRGGEKIDKREIPITVIMMYWTRMANCALIYEMINRLIQAILDTTMGVWSGKTRSQPR